MEWRRPRLGIDGTWSGERERVVEICSVRWLVRRWQVEVTFREVRDHLGVETRRQWSDHAIARRVCSCHRDSSRSGNAAPGAATASPARFARQPERPC